MLLMVCVWTLIQYAHKGTKITSNVFNMKINYTCMPPQHSIQASMLKLYLPPIPQ